jgi:hypothetical protein
MRVLISYEEILKEWKKSLSYQISMLDSFRSSSGTRASPPVLLDTGGGDTDDLPAVQEEMLPSSIPIFCHISCLFFKFPVSVNKSFFFVQTFSGTTLLFQHCVYGKTCLELRHLEQRRRFVNHHDLTSRDDCIHQMLLHYYHGV